MESGKPKVYVSAFFCTDIIRDKDTDLLTAIRITTAFNARPVVVTPKLPDGTPDHANAEQFFEPARLYVIINFHAEQATVFQLELKMKRPDGEFMNTEVGMPSGPCSIGGGANGALTLKIALSLDVKHHGEHWLEIYMDEEVTFKLPYLVIHPGTDSSPAVSQPGAGWSVLQHVR